MRRAVIAVTLLVAVSSQSQFVSHQTAAPPPLAEKIDVSVVNVDVSVTDRRGNPIPGLTRADFEILEDGKPQAVSNFYVVENAQARSDRPAAAESQAEAAPVPERFRRKVLVLVDNLNSTARGRNDALGKLETFINDHFNDGSYDWSVATIDSQVHLLLPLTSDKKILHDVVSEIRHSRSGNDIKATVARNEFDRVAEGPSRNLFQADTLSSGSHSVLSAEESRRAMRDFNEESSQAEQVMFAKASTHAISDAARAFGTSEGRKIILLVTGTLPLGEVSPIDRIGRRNNLANHIQTLTTRDAEISSMRDQLVREANASNTSVYIVAADGLEPPEQEVVNKHSGPPPARSNAVDTSAMYWLATETGGAYIPGNRLDQSLSEFDRRSATFYSLGYMPQHPEDKLYHRLTVHVKGHPEYQLQYRDGYSSVPTDEQMTRALSTTLGSAMQPVTMAMTLTVGAPQYRKEGAVVPIKATMSRESLQYISGAGGSHTRLHVYVSIFDRDGRHIKLGKSFADIIIEPGEPAAGPMTIGVPSLLLAKGTYNVVVAVRDELTDHVGIAAEKIDV